MTSLFDVPDSFDVTVAKLCAGRPVRIFENGRYFAIQNALIPQTEQWQATGPDERALLLTPELYSSAGGKSTRNDGLNIIEEIGPSIDQLLKRLKNNSAAVGEELKGTASTAAMFSNRQLLAHLIKTAFVFPVVWLWPLPGVSSDPAHSFDLTETSKSFDLTRVVGPVPLPTARTNNSTITLYTDGMHINRHHILLQVGEPDPSEPVLVRLHSRCLTGDVFGSRRCDCGDQLDATLKHLEEQKNGGLVLYLDQEGRGIGLTAKLFAYQLQDQGHDTFDANRHLGYANDERDFTQAARLVASLGYKKVRLITNNPQKVAALESNGLEVIEQVKLTTTAHAEQQRYRDAKRTRAGHSI